MVGLATHPVQNEPARAARSDAENPVAALIPVPDPRERAYVAATRALRLKTVVDRHADAALPFAEQPEIPAHNEAQGPDADCVANDDNQPPSELAA